MIVRFACAAAAVGVSLALAGCTYVRNPPPFHPPGLPVEAGPDAGRLLYQRDCGWCHGSRAEGTRNGPRLTGGSNGPALTDFMVRTGRMPLAAAAEPMRRRPSIYSEAEIDSIVEYVASLNGDGPPIPEPHPERADLGRGAELYLDNCAACHSTTGVGGSIVQGKLPGRVERRSGVVAPGVQDASALEIAEAIRTGPGPMPVFERGVLRDRDVDAIVRYVLYLQEPEDAGGAPIGRIGPVAEGAVAWFVGLGLLLGFSRWIGSRRE